MQLRHLPKSSSGLTDPLSKIGNTSSMVNRGPVKAPGAGENAHRRLRLNRRRFTGHRLANSKSEIRVRVYSTLSVKNTGGRPRVATDTEHGTQANSVHTCCDEDKTSCLRPAQAPALSHLQRHARTGGVAQGVGGVGAREPGRDNTARSSASLGLR